MSATGHQRRRREAAANEIVERLTDAQLKRFIAAAGLECAPTKESARAAISYVSEYPAMLAIADKIASESKETKVVAASPVSESFEGMKSDHAFEDAPEAIDESDGIIPQTEEERQERADAEAEAKRVELAAKSEAQNEAEGKSKKPNAKPRRARRASRNKKDD